jgi:hypothetical protein
MKKKLFTLLVSFSTLAVFAQEINKEIKQSEIAAERFPVFSNCENLQSVALENCFYNKVQDFIFQNFVVPENLVKNNFQDTIKVLFEVDSNGVFKVIYVNANDENLIQETKRVFSKFPKIQPSTFDGRPVYSKYNTVISIPLKSANTNSDKTLEVLLDNKKNKDITLTELDSIVEKKFNNPQFQSHLNIPFSHSYYAQFDAVLNQMGSNNHTASKPFTYAEVAKYYNFAAENEKLKKKAMSWFDRKLWNENLVEMQGDGYWFTLNPILDLELGKATGNKQVKTYVNTRGLNFRGGLGQQLYFTATVYESQGQFAEYYNRYAQSIKPSGGNPAIIPGIGIAKSFNGNAFDFPSADANLTYLANKYVDLQLGYGRNFIGDGYRSLLESDGASPYPYIKMNTNFWKIKYTNTYMWLKDVRPEATVDKAYSTKFMANHYLSLNVNNRLNLGFFESVVWANTNNRGFDMNFVNPIIFYRTVEFTSSGKSSNSVLGFTSKYKLNNQMNFYGQLLIDEFSVSEVAKGNGSWKNKFGYQLGYKYYNAFYIDNLLLQLELNYVRPYVYSHDNPITNYANNNQSMGAQWGGNFEEFIAIAHYHKGRFLADAKLTYGVRGFDFNTTQNNFNYGGNIYMGYNTNRPYDSGLIVGQGNKTSIFIADLQASYLVNPMTNLKLFGSYIYRSFDPTFNTLTTFKENTSWFSIGIRSDVFNMYYDY